jgi:O-antigen/teichoic acid export membrane protein
MGSAAQDRNLEATRPTEFDSTSTGALPGTRAGLGRDALYDKPFVARGIAVAGKAGSAVAGQALFSGAHFLLNVLLARWLPAKQYGIFALAYACFLLFSMMYSACVYEPLIVYGSGKYAKKFQGYLSRLFAGNLIFALLLTITMLATAFILGRLYSPDVERAFAALAVAGPIVLTTWLGRGGFYASLRPGTVAVAGAIYFSGLSAGLVVLRIFGKLSPVTAFFVMGGAAILANLSLFLRQRLSSGREGDTPSMSSVLNDHWRYGRWAMASAAVAWLPENVYYLVLPMRAGLESVAALRALINLINPVTHTLTALAAVLIPTLVGRVNAGGIPYLRRTVSYLLLIAIPAPFAYWAFLLFGRNLLFHFLYGGNYSSYSSLPLILVGVVPVTSTLAMILGAGLRAIERPDLIFWSFVASGLVAALIGIPLATRWGVAGATGGMVASGSTLVIAMTWWMYRGIQRVRKELIQHD